MRSLALLAAVSLAVSACTAHRSANAEEDVLAESTPSGSLEGGFSTSAIMARTLMTVYPSAASRWTEVQALTGSTPAYATLVAATTQPGLRLETHPHLRPWLCAETGQTLAGAGTLQAYFCDNGEEVCMRNPALDLPISVTATSCTGVACQCQVFPDMKGGGGVGFVRYVPSGVTVSAGTTVRVGVIGGTK